MPDYTGGTIDRFSEAKNSRAKTVPLEKAVNRERVGPPPARVNPTPTPTHGSHDRPSDDKK